MRFSENTDSHWGYLTNKITDNWFNTIANHMQLRFISPVNCPFDIVRDHFNLDLLEYLMPAFPPARILEWTGNTKGSKYHVLLNLPGLTMHWAGEVSAQSESGKSFEFTDKSSKMPFPIVSWEHVHRIEKTGERTCAIYDIMEYRCRYRLLEWLIWPGLYFSFRGRKSKYRDFFSKKL